MMRKRPSPGRLDVQVRHKRCSPPLKSQSVLPCGETFWRADPERFGQEPAEVSTSPQPVVPEPLPNLQRPPTGAVAKVGTCLLLHIATTKAIQLSDSSCMFLLLQRVESRRAEAKNSPPNRPRSQEGGEKALRKPRVCSSIVHSAATCVSVNRKDSRMIAAACMMFPVVFENGHAALQSDAQRPATPPPAPQQAAAPAGDVVAPTAYAVTPPAIPAASVVAAAGSSEEVSALPEQQVCAEFQILHRQRCESLWPGQEVDIADLSPSGVEPQPPAAPKPLATLQKPGRKPNASLSPTPLVAALHFSSVLAHGFISCDAKQTQTRMLQMMDVCQDLFWDSVQVTAHPIILNPNGVIVEAPEHGFKGAACHSPRNLRAAHPVQPGIDGSCRPAGFLSTKNMTSATENAVKAAINRLQPTGKVRLSEQPGEAELAGRSLQLWVHEVSHTPSTPGACPSLAPWR